MARQTAQPTEVTPFLDDSLQPGSQTLVDGKQLRVTQMVLEAGQESAPHVPAGEVLFQCVRGEVELHVSNESSPIPEGSMVYLTQGHSHSLKAVRDSVMLLIQAIHREPGPAGERTAAAQTEAADHDAVEEASEESFPASDPPSFTPGT